MKRLKKYVLLLLIGLTANAFSQTSRMVTGLVVDATSREPLAFSAVMLKGTQLSTETNAAGEFIINTTEKNHTLVVFQFGYATQEYIVNDGNATSVVIEMKLKAYNLNEVVVTSKKVDTLQANNRTLFLAFEFYDNYIVALVNKGKRYNMVQLMDENGKVVKEHKAPLGVEELFKDCLGNVQLISKDSSYQFYYNYENIELLTPYPIAVFATTLRPCQCVVGNNYYFKETTYKSLRNAYYLINKQDLQKKRLFTTVANTEAIDAFNTSYDINYFLNQRRNGLGYTTSLDELKAHIDELREDLPLSAEEQFKLNPIKSDFVKLDSSLLVVDYTHRKLFKHNFLGGLLKTDTLSLKNASPFVIRDADRKKVYFVKETNGLMNLYEYKHAGINPKEIVIEGFRFIKNVRCRNGTLYFLNKSNAAENLPAKIYTYRL
jgi:hypothetical protein